jgi:hypothetical protein
MSNLPRLLKGRIPGDDEELTISAEFGDNVLGLRAFRHHTAGASCPLLADFVEKLGILNR